jgi:hypothetical protein
MCIEQTLQWVPANNMQLLRSKNIADNVGIDALEIGLVGVDFVLNIIGFDLKSEREGLMEAGLNQFEDFRYLTEKDIREDMADDIAKQTITEGRIVYCLGRTKKLVGVAIVQMTPPTMQISIRRYCMNL